MQKNHKMKVDRKIKILKKDYDDDFEDNGEGDDDD